jgi:cell division protein FtsI (penicillin-binding protein 3)
VARPLAPSAQHWREINTMTIGFGHGISVTPLHVVNGVARWPTAASCASRP